MDKINDLFFISNQEEKRIVNIIGRKIFKKIFGYDKFYGFVDVENKSIWINLERMWKENPSLNKDSTINLISKVIIHEYLHLLINNKSVKQSEWVINKIIKI